MSEQDVNLNELFEIDRAKAQPTMETDVPKSKSNTVPEKKPQVEQTLLSSEITYSPSRTNNYKTIRILSGIFRGLAVLSLAAGILATLGLMSALTSRDSDGSALLYGMGVFNGLLFAAWFALFSEGINLFVDLEANTRQAAKTLERLLRTQD